MHLVVHLKPGRDKPVRQRHPWVFSGAVARVTVDGASSAASVASGSTVVGGVMAEVVAADGTWLARGYYNPRSQIVVRLLTWEADTAVDEAFWRAAIGAAIAARGHDPDTAGATAVRLVNAESDGLPGLVVDRYGPWLVLQALTLGIDLRKQQLARILMEVMGSADALAGAEPIQGVYERSDVDVRGKEGLPEATGPLLGEHPPARIQVSEPAVHGRPLRLWVDVRQGHKTGFYLDQRTNRQRVARWCGGGADVLNLFAYTGAFAVHALAAGAGRVVNVDSSGPALGIAAENLVANGFAAPPEDFVEADVFTLLRTYRAAGRQFDLLILDPPKFVHTGAQLDRAARAYKDLNRLAFHLLRPGGCLATFSCSGLVSSDLFQKIVFSAAVEAGRDAQIVEVLGQASDHPIRLSFPEAAYLKGLICRVPYR